MKRNTLGLLSLLLCVIFAASAFSACAPKEKNDGAGDKTQEGEKASWEEPKEDSRQGQLEKPQIDSEDPYLLLVNKTHPLEKTYEPQGLKSIRYFASDRDASTRYMVEEAADQFHLLVEAALAQGHEIVMTTAYRSYGFQTILWDNYVARHGEEKANTFSARPGESEHQSGLCTDVSSPSVGYQLTTEYGESPEGSWLAQNAHEYGFIIRYPKGKEDITGYQYEPWHIRYVGKEAASYMYQKQITLEEYLGILD